MKIKEKKKKVFANARSVSPSKSLFPGIRKYIRPEFEGLFRLIIRRSTLDGGTRKSRWGDAKSRWGDANSRWGMRLHYNLSAEYSSCMELSAKTDRLVLIAKTWCRKTDKKRTQGKLNLSAYS